MTNLDSILKAEKLLCRLKSVYSLGSSVNFHIHHSESHNHQTCCTGSGFRLPWENMDEFVEKVNREPQGQDMLPTVAISDIAGLGPFHLLKHLCSLFAFMSPC